MQNTSFTRCAAATLSLVLTAAAVSAQTDDTGGERLATVEPYARFQAHVAKVGDEAEVQDNPSWVGVRFSSGGPVSFLAHGEWSINLIESDLQLSPGAVTGGDLLGLESDEVPVLGNRLGYVGVDFGDGGRVLLGKQHSVHYDIANYTTDRLTAFGGGVATLAYPAGTDGGQPGTGRADQTLAYRNEFGIVQVGAQIQFENTTNDSVVDGVGASVRANVLADLQVGASIVQDRISDELIEVTPGITDDPRYAAFGIRYDSDVLELGFAFASQENGDLAVVTLPQPLQDEPEQVLVGFDATGFELFGRYIINSRFSIVGGFADYDPDVADQPLLDPEYRLRYGVLGAWIHATPNAYAYAEFQFEDSINETGQPADDAFAIGFRYNFGRRIAYRPDGT